MASSFSSAEKTARASRGLTLTELVIVLVLSALFVAFLGQMLSASMGAYQAVSPTLDAQSQVRYALERISRELRQIAVLTPANATATFNITAPAAGTNGGNIITFTREDGTAITIDGSSGTTVTITYPTGSGTLAQIASTGALVINFYQNTVAGNALAATYNANAVAAALAAIEVQLTTTVSGVTATGLTRVALRNTQ